MRQIIFLSIIITIIILILQGCSSNASIDAQKEASIIMSIYKERLVKIQIGINLDTKVDAYVEPLAEDAVWMPPNSPMIKGKEAVRKWAEKFFKNYTLKVDSIPENYLEIGNQIAIRTWRSVGKYIPQDGSTPVPYDQKYTDYFRRNNDRNWEYVVHMWNSNNAKPGIWHFLSKFEN